MVQLPHMYPSFQGSIQTKHDKCVNQPSLSYTMKLFLYSTLFLKTTFALLRPCTNETFSKICSKTNAYFKKSPGPPFLPKVTYVKPTVDVREILEANEDKHTVKILVQLSLKWQDPRVTYKRDEHEQNLTVFTLDPKEHDIWKPGLYFSNSIHIKNLYGFEHESLEFLAFAIKKSNFVWSKIIIAEFTCSMNFNEYPFDSQVCVWKMRNLRGPVNYVTFRPPIVTLKQVKSERLFSSSLAFDVFVTPLDSSIESYGKLNHSLAQIQFRLVRKADELYNLMSSFYVPTGCFALLSLLSFFIKPEIVPGRMGMLVTLFLIVVNVYGSVQAPAKRGFSYIEVWYIGTQLPIFFALLEYGFIIALMKLSDRCVFSKSLESLMFHVDLISCCLSFCAMILFNLWYWTLTVGKLNSY